MALGDLADVVLTLERADDLLRQRPQFGQHRLALDLAERLADLRETQGQEEHQRELGRERLGRCHPDLDAGVGVQRRVDLARDLRAVRVRDRQRRSAAPARLTQARQRVRGLAGLRDANDERARLDQRPAVAPFARDDDVAGQAGPVLQEVAPDQAGVIGRPAGHDDDAANVSESEAADALEVEHAVALIARQGLAHGIRLLVDLLEHEALVAALLGDFLVPGHVDDRALARLAVRAEDADRIARRGHDLAVLEVHHAPGLGGEGGDRGGQERLAVADAGDQRALMARADEQFRMVAVNRDECEVALELDVRPLDGLDQVAGVSTLDEVRDDLGVRFRAEARAGADQLALERGVILDDAVEHDRDVVIARPSAGARSPLSPDRASPSACGRCRPSNATRCRPPCA